MMAISPLTKSSAHPCQFNVDLFFWHSQAGSKRLYNEFRCLDWSIDFSFVCRNMGETVTRLHSIMCQEWSPIGAFNHFCSLFKGSFRIPIFTKNFTGLFRYFCHHCFMLFGALQTAVDFDGLFPPETAYHYSRVGYFFPFNF